MDTLAKSYIGGTSTRAGHAAAVKEAAKSSKYRTLSSNYHFVPFAVETLGVFGVQAKKLVHDIGQLIQRVTDDRRSTSFLFQRLSIAIQRGNASSILGSVKTDEGLDEVFYFL